MPPLKNLPRVGNGPYKDTRINQGDGHTTLTRPNSHISWDTGRGGGYVSGSGHTTDHGISKGGAGRITKWDRS